MSVLIICEKPSVAKTVALALGAAEQRMGIFPATGCWCHGASDILSAWQTRAAMTSDTKSGAMRIFPFCRRRGNMPLLPAKKSSLPS